MRYTRDEIKRWYGKQAWKDRRSVQLTRDPLCAMCMELGIAEAATVADHIIPHRGCPRLFNGELQSLCKRCHDSVKAREENTGRRIGHNADGSPAGGWQA